MQLFVDAAANTSTVLQPEDNCIPGPPVCAGMMEYLAPATMLRAAEIFKQATTALDSAHDTGFWSREVLRLRLRVAELPTLYVIMLRWQYVRAWAVQNNRTWPLASTNISDVYQSFADTYRQHGMDDGVWCNPTATCNVTCQCSGKTAPSVDNALGEWFGAGLPWFKKQIGA